MMRPGHLLTAFQAALHLGVSEAMFYTYMRQGRMSLTEATRVLYAGGFLYDRAALDYDREIMSRVPDRVEGVLFDERERRAQMAADRLARPCPQCKVSAGRGCRTPGGNSTRPHTARTIG